MITAQDTDILEEAIDAMAEEVKASTHPGMDVERDYVTASPSLMAWTSVAYSDPYEGWTRRDVLLNELECALDLIHVAPYEGKELTDFGFLDDSPERGFWIEFGGDETYYAAIVGEEK